VLDVITHYGEHRHDQIHEIDWIVVKIDDVGCSVGWVPPQGAPLGGGLQVPPPER
jgi:DNA ligase (NAD+)